MRRSPEVIQTDPNSSVECPHKRHTGEKWRKGDLRGRDYNEPAMSQSLEPPEAGRDKDLP